METKEKTYTLSEAQFEELVIQVGALKQIYDKVKENRNMSLFEKNVLLKNKTSNESMLKELEEIHKKSQ